MPVVLLLNGTDTWDRVKAAAATHGTRVVNVAEQDSLNVTCGDVVTFQSGGKTFSWKFDTTRHSAVDLQKIAPAGFSEKNFKVYVSRNEGESA